MSAPLPSGSLAAADLTGSDLSGGSLAGRDLAGATLDGANLSDVSLAGANLRGARLRGTRLVHADLTGAVLDGADLTGADLSGATLVETSLRGVTLRSAKLAHTEWRKVEADGGDWSDCDLSGAVLQRVRLIGVDLRGARLVGARLTDTDLERVTAVGLQGDGLVAVDTSFVDVDLSSASLVEASVRFADVKEVRFAGADLQRSVFESVDFRGTPLNDALVAGARLERCAGLDRAARRRLEAGGAVLPVPLLWRALRLVLVGPLWVRFAVLVVIAAGVGLYTWTTVKQTDPGPRDIGPEELVGEQRAAFALLEQRFATEPDRRLETLQEMAAFLDALGAEAAAETKLRAALELIETNEQEPPVQPLLALGDFLLRHERFDDALSFTRELDQPGAGPREIAMSRLILAKTLVARGNAERADEVVDDLIAHVAADPLESPIYRLEAARVVETVRGPAAALPLLEGVPASLDLEERGGVALERAALLARLGQIGDAVEAYDGVMAAFEDLPLVREHAREERGRLLRTGADPAAEERRLTELAAGDSELAAQSTLGLARLALRRGDVAGAERWFLDAHTRFAPDAAVRVTAALGLSELAATRGDSARGIAILDAERRAGVAPEQELALRQALADRREQAGDLPGALAEGRATVAWAAGRRSLELRAQLALAGLADAAGKLDEALDLYKAVAMAGEDPAMTAAAWFGQATLMRRRGAPEAALPLMDSALASLPAQHRLRGSIAAERAELLAELGRSSPLAVEQMLADARAASLPETQPVAYASLLLLLARELRAASRHEDALNVFEQVAGSPAGGEEPSLRQEAVQGQVAALVALGRQDQAAALLDSTSLELVTAGEAEQLCGALLALAQGRLKAGENPVAVQKFEALFATCRSPGFLLGVLPEVTDLLVAAGLDAAAQALLGALADDAGVPPEGRQAACLELGRLGSVPHLERASAGPDASLATLARVETAQRLIEAGQVDQARKILTRIAADDGAEAFPRGLARLGLGRLSASQDDRGGARVWFVLVRDESGDPWLRAQAEDALTALEAPTGT